MREYHVELKIKTRIERTIVSRETFDKILDKSLQDPDGVKFVVANKRNGTRF